MVEAMGILRRAGVRAAVCACVSARHQYPVRPPCSHLPQHPKPRAAQGDTSRQWNPRAFQGPTHLLDTPGAGSKCVLLLRTSIFSGFNFFTGPCPVFRPGSQKDIRGVWHKTRVPPLDPLQPHRDCCDFPWISTRHKAPWNPTEPHGSHTPLRPP